MSGRSPSARDILIRYLFSIAIVALACWLRVLIDPVVGDRIPFITLFAAIAFATWYGGLGPAVCAIVLSVVASLWLFIPPDDAVIPTDADGAISIVLFISVAGGIAWLMQSLRATRQRAVDAAGLLAAERERFRVTLSSIGDGVIVTDTNSRVTFINGAAELLTGWTFQDALGQPLETVFPIVNEDTELPVENPVARALREGTVVGLANHTKLIPRTGTQKAIDDSAAPIYGADGRIVGVVLVFRDVSTKRNAEHALRASEEQFRQLANSIPQLAWMARPDGHIFWYNQRWYEYTGATPAEMEGWGWQAVHDAEELPRVIERWRAALTAREPWEDTFPLRRHDGVFRWHLSRAMPLVNDAGEVEFWFGSNTDITEQREAAEQIRLQATMLAAVNQAVVATDAEGVIIYWNAYAETLYGWTAAEAVGRQVLELIIPPETRAEAEQDIERMRRGESFNIERIKCRRDGSRFPALVSETPVFDEQGRLKAILRVSADITERKQAEDSLRFLADASRSLSTLVDYRSTLHKVARLAVPLFADWCVVDLLNGEGTLERVALAHRDPNKIDLAERLARDRPADNGRPFGVWGVIRTGQPEIVPLLDEAWLERHSIPAESRALVRQLQLRSYMCVPLSAHGRILGVITFLWSESGRTYRDRDLRLAEDFAHRAAVAIENARLYQALRNADRRKDEFLAMLAHELRNPLAPIRTGLDVLSIETNGQSETIEVMQRQIEHLVRLVDDLLDMSRIVGGKIELRRESLELSGIVERAVEAVQHLVHCASHKLEVHLPEDPIWVTVDPVRMVQVLENLLSNACKYTDSGGQISLRVEREEDGVAIRVRDNGVGLDSELLPHVFDLFTQSTRSLDRSQGGLGIGLTLVRTLVEMHGGTVAAFSDGPQRGSEFVVRLPIGEPGATPAPERPRSMSETGRRILVVDDNVGMARIVSRLLSKLGPHEVRMTHDGPSALDLVRQFHPEIVLLDIGLPGMDGYQVGQSIRQHSSGSEILLVALTGYGQEEDRRRSRDAGFDEHLVKPPSLQNIEMILAHPKLAAPDVAGDAP
jgi:PAS domain S-box-containing protein